MEASTIYIRAEMYRSAPRADSSLSLGQLVPHLPPGQADFDGGLWRDTDESQRGGVFLQGGRRMMSSKLLSSLSPLITL